MEIALHWNRDFSNHFAWESKFVPVIGILRNGGKQCLAGEARFASKYGEFQDTESSRIVILLYFTDRSEQQ